MTRALPRACVAAVLACGLTLAATPGDEGYARTALEGDRIETVPVRYVGVLTDALGPGTDLHLVELLGDVGEDVGIAGGMSGSPVYFEDRLFGAMSYRLGTMPKRAIAGVTTIEAMRSAAVEVSRAPADDRIRPIATPVGLVGVAPAIREWLGPRLAKRGLVIAPAAGQTASASGAESSPLAPGSPVGVQMVRGDLSISATGTVTTIDGDVVYAFGHPFLGSGRIEAPMVRASVVHILADGLGSVKLASVGDEIGAVLDDRLTAIVGRLGATASVAPLSISIREPERADEELRFEVATASDLAPLLFAAAASNGIVSRVAHDADATLEVRGAIELEGHPDIPVDAVFTSQGGPHPAVRLATDLHRTLQSLYSNPFGEVRIRNVRLDVSVSDGPRSYLLEKILYDRGGVRPGQDLEVTCVLRPRRGERIRTVLHVPVPAGVAPGTRLALAVGSPGDLEQVSGRPLARRLQTARDLTSYIEILGASRGEQHLTAVLFRADDARVTDGEWFTELPASARRWVDDGTIRRALGKLRVAPIASAEHVLDGPVSGGLAGRIDVRRQGGQEP